jgi:hypothetical protein
MATSGSHQNWNFLFFIFFPCNISIPAGLQHSCRYRRLCVDPVEIGLFFLNNKKIIYYYFYYFYFPCNISIPVGMQHNCRHRRLCMGPSKIEMRKEFFDLEFYVIDFSFKGLVFSRYLGLEVLNILVLDFGWMQ